MKKTSNFTIVPVEQWRRSSLMVRLFSHFSAILTLETMQFGSMMRIETSKGDFLTSSIAVGSICGSKTADNLLRRFGSVEGIVNASEEELREVDLVGRKRSGEIHSLLHSEVNEGKEC